MSDLASRIALVTGAGSGIGRAAAVAYARAGARGVVLAGRQTRALEETAELVDAHGAVSLIVTTDVSANVDVENLLATTLHQFDAVDACFNNAGTLGSFLRAKDMTEADFDATISVNLKGGMAMLQASDDRHALGKRRIDRQHVLMAGPWRISWVVGLLGVEVGA